MPDVLPEAGLLQPPPAGPTARVVARHPRLWGLLFAVLLLVAYVYGVRPAREWTAAHVAAPLFASIDTPRAQRYSIIRPSDYVPGDQLEAVFAVETARLEAGRAAGKAAPDIVRETIRAGQGVAYWVAPVGVLFLLPAMFLLVAFPTRPFWLVLLGYHLVVGAVSLAVFAIGLGWYEPAFRLYLFTRTYLTESVSLVVPLLLYLAARGAGPLALQRVARPEERAETRV